MQFSTLSEVIHMGGHGPYVWSAYAVSLVALLLLAYLPRRKQRRLLRRVVEQQRLASKRVQQTNSQSMTS